MADRIIPQAFPPGEFIQDSLKARGWSQADLADITGVFQNVVSDWVSGKRKITTKTAQILADAFGNDAEEWAKLQAIYDVTMEALSRDASTVRRSRLWHRVPVRHIINRGWITESENIETLEAEILEFYESGSIDSITPVSCAARKSTDYSELSNEQRAWFMRARQLAKALPMRKKYNPRTFRQLLDELEPLRAWPEEARKVPEVLARYGIRFFVIEHLPSSKIDGVCFWIGKAQDEPAIVLSMRYDRIDWFWFTLMHELAHIFHGHGKDKTVIDMSLVGNDAQPFSEKQDEERVADEFASEYLIDSVELTDFLGRVNPQYSDVQIKGFADRMNVHAGIVVGRLQHLGRIPYSRGRAMLVKIRDNIIETALTDGWNHSIEL
jgi:HTH-type transcriptional regulator/antitoxin HigA